MTKYEYRVTHVSKMTRKSMMKTLQDELNGMGEMGWEALSVDFDPKTSNLNECIVIYKRQLVEHE